MVKGIAELTKKLTVTMPAKVDVATRRAMEKGADELVKMMKRLAPIDDGDLQMSISWTWGDAPKGTMTLAKVDDPRGGGGLKITVYAGGGKAYYARFVEFGTLPHVAGGMFKGAAHPGASKQPFFFPAYRALEKRIRSRIIREMKKAIRSESSE